MSVEEINKVTRRVTNQILAEYEDTASLLKFLNQKSDVRVFGSETNNVLV